MTGLPTLTVELEDGSGNFTNDVSQYVRLDKGWSLSRGWSDENDEDSIQPAILRLRLDNTDGKFTLGAANFNGITKHKRIRLTETYNATVYRRVVGYVNDWPTQWDSAMANIAYAAVSATDRFGRLNRRKLRSRSEQEVLLDGPVAYYPLSEPAGSTSAGDVSGNTRAALTLAGETTPAVVFGSTVNVWDGLTGCVFAGSLSQFLSAPVPMTGTSFTLEVLTSLTTVGTGIISVPVSLFGSGPTQAYFASSTGGGLTSFAAQINSDSGAGLVVATPTTIVAGQQYHLALTYDNATLRLYLDGTQVASTAGVNGTSTFTSLNAGAAPQSAAGTGARHLGMSANIAVYNSALSAARILSHANALKNGSASDRADQRMASLASYANIAVGDQNLETGLQPSMAAQSTSGGSVFDAMQQVAESEGGAVFIAGDGKLTFHNKSHRVLRATGTPAISIAASLIDADMTWASDNYLFNTATGTRLGGATQRSVNAASVLKYEEWPITRDSALLPTDELVLNELQWITTMYGEPLPRLSSVTFDLLTLPTATVQALLALELGDLMRISSWPTQSPLASVDLIVEGSNEAQTEKTWSITFNTAPAGLFRAWILDDATYSVLDSTTRLYQ